MSQIAQILPFLIVIAVVATAVVLVMGIASMGFAVGHRSETENVLMRWRVATQGLAVAFMAAFLWAVAG